MLEEASGPRTTPIPPRGRIPYFYWNNIRNCGDALNAYILRDVVGVEGVPRAGTGAHLMGIGSILKRATPHSRVWGSGVLRPDMPMRLLAPRQIKALRGTRTRDHLRSLGIAVPDVPLGDPGMLCARLLDGAARTSRYRAAVVPHHASWGTPFFEDMRRRDDVCVIDMMDDSLLPLEQIALSEVVLSQSLHGLVFAEALGKPNLWISRTARPDWTFKFEDWFSTTAEPQDSPVLLPFDLVEACQMARLHGSTIRCDALLSAFPHELIEPHRADGLISFDQGRAAAPLNILVDTPLASDAQPVGRTISALRATAMRRYVEPIYCAILPPALVESVDRHTLVRAMRHLDINHQSQFVWFALGPPGDAETEFKLQPAAPEGRALPPGGIMLRPTGSFDASASYSLYGG